MDSSACSLICVIAAALFGAMLYVTFNPNKDTTINDLLRLLTSEQNNVYKEITNERLRIYVIGLVLGLLVGFIYLQMVPRSLTRSCSFLVTVMGINYAFYMLYPKTKYMLPHLTNDEQRTAWLAVYKEMQKSNYIGLVIGAVSYLLVSLL